MLASDLCVNTVVSNWVHKPTTQGRKRGREGDKEEGKKGFGSLKN